MPTDLDAIDEKREQIESNPLENLWKPDAGVTIVRFLPPTSDWFSEDITFIAYQFGRHFFNLGSDEIRISRCLRDRDGKCPACIAADRDYDDPQVEEMTEWGGGRANISVSTRYAMNVLVLEEADEGVRYYDGNYTIWEQLIKIMANRQKGDIIDPVKGRNVELDIPEQGSNHKANDIHPSDDQYPRDVRRVLKKARIGQDEFMADLDGLKEVVPDYAKASEMKEWMGAMGFPQFDSNASGGEEDLDDWPEDEPESEPEESSDDGESSEEDEWSDDWGDDPQDDEDWDDFGEEDEGEWDDDFGFDGSEPDPLD